MTAIEALAMFTQSQASSILARHRVALCEVCEEPIAAADLRLCRPCAAELTQWTRECQLLIAADRHNRQAEAKAVRL